MGDKYANKPRLCTVRKWADFPGYGFNLHAERGKAGQYIGKVDEGSPAQAAGMKEGDRIVEVNNVNIGNENHSQVVNRIKAGGDQVSMLLVDLATDQHFKDQKVVISSELSEVARIETPPRPSADQEIEEQPEPEAEQDSDPEPEAQQEVEPEPVPVPVPEPDTVEGINNIDQDEPEDNSESGQANSESGQEIDEISQENAEVIDEDDIPPPPPDSELPTYDDATQEEPEPQRTRTPSPETVTVLPAITKASHDYHPRHCYIKKWPDFQGYGFNLHAEKEKTGQYIGTVDDNSPAEQAGLRSGDRIIEVNGVNIEDETHAQVIQRIKAGGDETKLLVVDSEADEFYQNNGLRIHSGMEEVTFKETIPREAKVISPPVPKMTYHPRQCSLVKWPDFNGYGFNLHAEKERGGQYIGKIDANSPAEEAGLRENDRIIEVNGANIEDETHQQVIGRIKAGGDETKLLVVDKAADAYYKGKGITVTPSLPEVKFLAATPRTPRSSAAVSNGDTSNAQPTRVRGSKAKRAPTPPSSPPEEHMFNMSAAEMRKNIVHVHRKKSDRRVNRTSMTEKLNIFEQL